MITITTAERDEAWAASRHWFLKLLLGILFLVFGFIIFGYDDRSLKLLSIFVGVSFLLTALSWFLIAIVVEELRWLWIVAGLIGAGAGVAALVYPDETLKVLSLFLGWFLFLGGIVQFIGAVTAHRDREGWWTGVIVGVLFVGLGAWAVADADHSLAILTTLVGIYCVVKGVYEIVVALYLRRVKHELAHGF